MLYPSDRLSSGLTTCLCQDSYGYIWIGTEHGLNKFDGYRFTTYYHSRTDPATLTDNEVAALFVDSHGQLWVGCARGLVRYDYDNDRFQRYHFPDHQTPRVNAITETKDGKLLIGTAGYGLYSVNAKGYTDYESAFNHKLTDPFYSRLHIDREGSLWSSNHQTTITRVTLSNGQPATLHSYQSPYGQPVCYMAYGHGLLLIVCMHGILAYDYKTGRVNDAGFDLAPLNHTTSIEDACLTADGDILIATQGAGLMKIAKGSWQLTRVEHSNGHISLGTAQVVDIMEDKNHHLWAACYNKGLMMLSRHDSPFSTWSLSAQQYVTGGGVSSIAMGDHGDSWCTVKNGGVFCFNQKGQVTAYRPSPPGTRLIYRSQSGTYWLLTEKELFRYQPHTGNAVLETTLDGRGLNSICEDAQGRLYISNFERGLYVYNPATRKGLQLSMTQTGRRGGYLCNDWIKAMTFDSRGLLWICTTSGIAMMQPEGCVFNSRGWNALLEGTQCHAVCETSDGNLLFGTENGLFRYDWSRDTIATLPSCSQLDGKMICAMVRDSTRHDIWISTNHGVWQYCPDSDSLICHVGYDGLTPQEFMLGAALHAGGDRIMFGTADGVVAFLPRTVTTSSRKLGRAILTHITANGRTLNARQTRYVLPYSDNSLDMEFSLLDYNNAENITFQYRINGSAYWTQGREGINQLSFNQLQPGDYRIEVRASAGDLLSADVTTVSVTILAPWYKSTWVYILYAIAIMLLGTLVAFSWNRYMLARRQHLTIRDLRRNMHWLRNKFFGSLEEKGDIQPIKVKGNNDALMERIVKCVNENMTNPDFTVEILTREVGISRSQLHRKMKEMTGLSVSAFVRNLRLEQAARLISEKKINVTQVAYSVGFNNQAHFSTVFKKHFGMTPTAYANQHS